MLMSDQFTYWDGQGREIPARFRDSDGVDVCVGRQGHKCNFPEDHVEAFLAWIQGLGITGYTGRPQDW